MTFLIMMDKNGKVLRHLFPSVNTDKKLIYTMLNRYIEIGFPLVDYVIITYKN